MTYTLPTSTYAGLSDLQSGMILLYTQYQMHEAFAAGAASRDAEIAHLKQELQIECASNAIKDTDTAALRADALRYRWLRNHVIFGYPSSEGSSNKAAYLVVTGYGYRESKKLTDQAIDAASAAEGEAP